MTGTEGQKAAHRYLDQGFQPVGWIILGGAKAAVSMKGRHYADYTITHAEIDGWRTGWQVGLAMCREYWALDFDCGKQRVDEFFAENVVTPTATQMTRRGFHAVYRGTGGCEWPRDGVWSAGWLDVQVRSNGFIAAAPSVHPSGRRYHWLDDRMPAEPGTLLLAGRPEREARHLSGRGGPGRDGGPDGDLTYYAAHGIPVGWQDSELHRLACRHVRSMDRQELFRWLWACVQRSAQNPQNPWRREDVMSKIRRAAEFTGREDTAALTAYRRMEASGYGR